MAMPCERGTLSLLCSPWRLQLQRVLLGEGGLGSACLELLKCCQYPAKPGGKESHGTLLKTSLLDFDINLTLKIEAITSIENWGSRFYSFKMDPKLVLGCYATVSHRSILVFFKQRTSLSCQNTAAYAEKAICRCFNEWKTVTIKAPASKTLCSVSSGGLGLERDQSMAKHNYFL